MTKHNIFIKKVKKLFSFINTLIESYFNKLKFFKLNYKKIIFKSENKVVLSIGIVVILTLSYFLLPTFYDKRLIQNDIEKQILKKYDIDIKFNKEIRYSLLPKPHFSTKDLSINRGKKEIGLVENFKIYISTGSFYKLNEIEIKDLVFNKGDFNINKEDFIFFKNLLNIQPNENKFFFKNNNIFFKSEDDELLFINKISDGKLFYDSNRLSNILIFNNEAFNVPFNLKVENNKFNKKMFTKFTSKKIRVNIENEFNYESENDNGILDISFINKSTSLNYKFKTNSLTFSSQEIKNKYDGGMDFKPFYFYANFNYDGLSTKTFFDRDTILVDLIKSEIFKNQNLNAKLTFKVKNITDLDELNNLFVSLDIGEGNIALSNSKVMWKNDVEIILSESYLNYDNDQISLDGLMTFNFDSVDNFYQSFQVNKNYRKKMKKIEIYFVYDLNENKIVFSNPMIDGKSNNDIERYIGEFNLKESDIFNKIKFKNFVNNFLKAYAG